MIHNWEETNNYIIELRPIKVFTRPCNRKQLNNDAKIIKVLCAHSSCRSGCSVFFMWIVIISNDEKAPRCKVCSLLGKDLVCTEEHIGKANRFLRWYHQFLE